MHVVSSASDAVAVSIHVYGANIGAMRRPVFDYRNRRRPRVRLSYPDTHGARPSGAGRRRRRPAVFR
ncbi:MAG: hypothetical protein IPO58_06920 [Betaproteobacteria bacterium]|nr:hypothetical protein [Betaproteobacteria bacterium]